MAFNFSSLAKYSSFILNEHVDDVAKITIQKAREFNAPLLKLLSHFSEDQLFQMARKGLVEDFLNPIIEDRAFEVAKRKIEEWKANHLIVPKDQIHILDITVVSNSRKLALLEFLKEYECSKEEYLKIIEELDRYFITYTDWALEAYEEIQRGELKEKEEILSGVLNNIPVIVTKVNREGYITRSLGSGLKFLGIENKTQRVVNILKDYPDGHNIKQVLDGHAVIFSGTAKGILGEIRHYQSYFFPEKDGALGFSIDITDKWMAEEKLRQLNNELEGKVNERTIELVESEKRLLHKNQDLVKTNNDLDNFIYTASHDLRAPVSNIEGLMNALSDTLKSNSFYSEDVERIIKMIEGSVKRFQGTLKELTEISKIQKASVEDVVNINVCETIENIKSDIQGLIKETDAIVHLDTSQCPLISFSKANFRSIVYNLLTNAIKYRAPERQAKVEIKFSEDHGYNVLEVRDNGLGIKKEHHDKIFAMFKRMHDHVEGTGVGLYIVKRSVENAGGKIVVESEEGKGSIFKVYFKNS
jgi:signal transduction histidine kinase